MPIESLLIDDAQARQRLYNRYPYLQDVAEFEYRGCMLNVATHLGWLEADDFMGVILAYPIEHVLPSPTHEVFLSRQDNLKICQYRHLRVVQPWPQPTVGVSMKGATGQVTGAHKADVPLKQVGEVQLWWGQDIGVIWEAYLSKSVQGQSDFEALMNHLWTITEGFLVSQGVQRMYTLSHEPELDAQWYAGFLQHRGYQPVEGKPQAMVKMS